MSIWVFPKIGVFPPKWMVYNLMENLIKMDDLEVPLFSEISNIHIFMCLNITSSVRAIEEVEAEEDKTLERELKSLFGNSEVLQLRKELGDVFSPNLRVFLDADETGRGVLHVRLMRFINFRGPTDDSERNEQEATN